jgi:hypothetical protein
MVAASVSLWWRWYWNFGLCDRRPKEFLYSSVSIGKLTGVNHSEVYCLLWPCFSIHCSSQNAQKTIELTEEPIPVHNQLNVKLNTRIFYLLCTLNVKHQRLTLTLPITWSFRLTHWRCLWPALLTELTVVLEASGFKQRLIVWMLAVAEWLVSNVATRISIRTYKFRTANKTLASLRIFVPRITWHPFGEPWVSEEPSLRNIVLWSLAVHHRVLTSADHW